MHRKDFMKRMGMLTFGGSLFTEAMKANTLAMANTAPLRRIGVQLFTLPASLEKDFENTIAMLAGMGYKEIELFGPYPFSAESAKNNWKAISGFLGFSGSGYFGRTEKQLKSLFQENGLTVPAMHTDLETLETRMEYLGAAGDALGFRYVILPSIPEERRKTPDDYRRMAEVFNNIGQNAKREGLRFAYHNHGYGLNEREGVIPLQLLLDNTDPGLVFLEMDLFWHIAGKADPIAYMKKYKNRYQLMHVKDMKQIRTFSGEGAEVSQWMELFPNMAAAGEGAVDLKNIIPFARKYGVRHFFVENDLAKEPETALQTSIDFLKKL